MHAPSSDDVVEIGIPVRAVNWVRLHPGTLPDGRPSLLASMGQNNGGLFVLDIDLETGHCRQFSAGLKGADYPTAAFRSLRTGILYIGSAWPGHLHRYDPASGSGLEDLGAIDPELCTFPCGITEAPDGALYIGYYPGAGLVRFDTAARGFHRLGRLDEVEKYSYPLAGDDGSLAAAIKMVRPHVVLIDPATGRSREAGPCVTDTTDKAQFVRLVKGEDGRLYITSHAGVWRVAGMDLEPADGPPAEMPGIHATYKHGYQVVRPLPGGWIASFDDGDNGSGLFRRVRLDLPGTPGRARLLDLDWDGEGTNIFHLHAGSDGRLYGSSILPEHLFVHDPAARTTTNLGRCSVSLGEAYSMGNLPDGRIVIASYPEARISLFDPDRPCRFGTEPDSNPRDIGRLDAIGYRPGTMAVTPDGRVWIGSAPDYGLLGGTLAWYDPATGAMGSHRHIVPDCTPCALAWIPGVGRLLVGISTEAGTGAEVRAKQGAFVLWDPVGDAAEWTGDFGIENLPDVLSLAVADDGVVVALIGRFPFVVEAQKGAPAAPSLVWIDPVARRLLGTVALPGEWGALPHNGHHALRVAPDGTVYGASTGCIFMVGAPGQVTPVWTAADGQVDVLGPVIGDRLYFASGWRLRAVPSPARCAGLSALRAR